MGSSERCCHLCNMPFRLCDCEPNVSWEVQFADSGPSGHVVANLHADFTQFRQALNQAFSVWDALYINIYMMSSRQEHPELVEGLPENE